MEVLDHHQLLGHANGQEILGAGPSFSFGVPAPKVLTVSKTVVGDAISDPLIELPLWPEPAMQAPCVDSLSFMCYGGECCLVGRRK